MTELSQGQQYAFEKFQRGENLFVSGPGGSGKSHLIKYFVDHLYKNNTIHQVTSTTGCSSILLSNSIRIGGRPIIVKTIHSWSGIRLGKASKEDIVASVMKIKRIVREWRLVKTLIIDEISMLPSKLFKVLDEIGKKAKKNSLPFGGIQIVCLGDFFQLPPVSDWYDPESSAFCFESSTWLQTFPRENHIELTTIYRQSDPLYQRILNEVRIGKLSEESKQELQKRVGLTYDPANHGGITPMKIFATRNQVNLVNKSQYDKIQESEHIFHTTIKTNATRYIETGLDIDEDILDYCKSLTPREIEYECNTMTNNMPSEIEVRLKRGNPVMCLVNLDVESGIANGSMGVIEDFVLPLEESSIYKEKIPLVRFANGIVKTMGKYTWQSNEYPTVCVSQIPLCLAYSNSIHKMQGSTLDVCEMNLGGSVFAEHQTYVALSRVKSLEGVYLSAFHPQRIRVNPTVVQFYQQFPSLPEAPRPEAPRPEAREAPEPSSVFAKSLEQFICPNFSEVSSGEASVPCSPLPDDSTSPLVVGGCKERKPPDHDYDKECPMCLDNIEKPYITQCNHTYCFECITRLITCSYGKSAACPLCRAVVTIRTIRSLESEKKKGTVSRILNKKSKGLMISRIEE